MIINEKIIMDIFNLKVKIPDKDKDELSKYQELIPMYDIYSQQIYPIKKNNLHYRLIDSNYRFINNEIYSWLKNLYKKNKSNKILCAQFKKNLDIIDNYNIDILIVTSYKTLYEYSPKLGLLVSICKRKSFDPYISHLKPYYSKLELIKLGQNMKLIKNIELEKLLDKDFHYEICKKVSSNDVSFEEIKEHTLHIIKSNCISYVTFYSFFGSFLYNKYLRGNKSVSTILYNGIIKLINTMKTSPKLNNNYYIYRFIWDDSFISKLNINDIFIDNGFLSTTRDPFYSPGLNGNFGLTLIKINIPENITGLGLMIENFSLFAKEEEFLLPPNSKLKLISKDDNFKYFHTNESFEKLINKKYEFEFIENDFSLTKNIKIKDTFTKIDDIKTFEIFGDDRIHMFKNFISSSSEILVTHNNNKYLLSCTFFDSTESSSYNKLYFNKIKDGLLISIYDNGYPYINIECGKEMVINYINQFYFYNNQKTELNQELCDLILEFGRIFYYKEAKIFYNYRNFSEFKVNDDEMFLYMNLYNHTLYDFAKNKNKFINYDFIKNFKGWYVINQQLDTPLTKELTEKYNFNKTNPDKSNTIRNMLIYIIENEFSLYEKFIDDINKIFNINFHKDNYYIYEIYEKLNQQHRISTFKSNINYEDEEDLGSDFKLIFRQPLRRF